MHRCICHFSWFAACTPFHAHLHAQHAYAYIWLCRLRSLHDTHYRVNLPRTRLLPHTATCLPLFLYACPRTHAHALPRLACRCTRMPRARARHAAHHTHARTAHIRAFAAYCLAFTAFGSAHARIAAHTDIIAVVRRRAVCVNIPNRLCRALCATLPQRCRTIAAWMPGITCCRARTSCAVFCHNRGFCLPRR